MLVVRNDMLSHAVKEPECLTKYSYDILLFIDHRSHNFSRNLNKCIYLTTENP